jgi:hypothetical protein
MKRVSFTIIFAALALYLQSQATVWVGYFAFQEVIATYCENKSNPDCNGKCQAKKIEEKTHRDSPSGTLIQVSIPDLSEFLVKKSSVLFLLTAQPLRFYISCHAPLAQGFSRQVFRPPTSV